MNRITVMMAVFIAVYASSLAAQTRSTWLDKDFVYEAFIDVAMKNEYSAGDKPLVKWREPIRIWVNHKVGDQALHDELTDAHLLHLTAITGHPIRRVNSQSEANIAWVYTRESQWREDVSQLISPAAANNLYGAICKAGYKTKRGTGEIVSAAIVIPVDQAREHGKLLACIVEEITQVLGLPNDSLKAYPSIFNDETPEDLLSPLDIVLLKLLYHPSLKTGMSKKQVSPILKDLIKTFEEDGTLQQAVNGSKQAPLYQMVGY